MTLIREILLRIEDGTVLSADKGEDEELWAYHVWLLGEAGLAEGIVADWGIVGPATVTITSRPRLTWQGCEFLSAARNDGYWQARLRELKEKAGMNLTDLPFEVIKTGLIQGLMG